MTELRDRNSCLLPRTDTAAFSWSRKNTKDEIRFVDFRDSASRLERKLKQKQKMEEFQAKFNATSAKPATTSKPAISVNPPQQQQQQTTEALEAEGNFGECDCI